MMKRKKLEWESRERNDEKKKTEWESRERNDEKKN